MSLDKGKEGTSIPARFQGIVLALYQMGVPVEGLLRILSFIGRFETEEPPTLPSFDPTLYPAVAEVGSSRSEERIRQDFVAFLTRTKVKAIVLVPIVMDRFYPSYRPLDSNESLVISQVCKGLFEKLHCDLSAFVLQKVAEIRNNKLLNPQFLLNDDEMEMLRRALYLIDAFHLTNTEFCDRGINTLIDLRTYISEYERKHICSQ